MRLTRLLIQGFRCFGESTAVTFDELTALVGANGSGKTAVLMALVRMFGTTNAQRTLTKEDFYADPGTEPPADLHLLLDATFEFPELLSDNDDSGVSAVPECLRHIMLTATATVPQCRIMLKGTWRQTASADGDVEQELLWVDSDDEQPPEDAVHHLSSVERSLIQVFYVPATRDAVRELRAVSGTILSRALQRVAWSDAVKQAVQDGTQSLTDAVRSEAGLQSLEVLLTSHWAELRGDARKPLFSFADDDLPSVLRKLDTRLTREDGTVVPLSLLSEGERSLMYFALVQSALAFERRPLEAGDAPSLVETSAPVLTVLAVEEPENHLAPQYLGRILGSLRGAIATGGAQAVVTSHSASLMRRIEPDEVRHLRINAPGVHHISELTLPSDSEQAFKYVREAVRSYPELYFARAVVLCEGPSEEVVLPHVARVLGLDIDPRFVAVVPLGGRHVHHFWRLLRELRIPYATLLDLDLERHGGGWQRIHGAMQELIELGETRTKVLGSMPEGHFAGLAALDPPSTAGDPVLGSWLGYLETNFSIFFSAPLDLDLMLLQAFEDSYKALAPPGGGPRTPTTPAAQKKRAAAVSSAVLGAEGGTGASYPAPLRTLFAWYSYLFLSRGKPATHAAVFAELDDASIRSGCPAVLSRLVEHVKHLTT